MSANFFDLQKFAATGIASPDMTAYDKARALAAFGGGKTQTLTGVPPLFFKANGKPLVSWSMSGNGSQTGTPTPDAPIMPEGTGDKTKNLFDGGLTGGYYRDTSMDQMMGDGTVFKSFKTYLHAGTYTLHFDIRVSFVRAIYDNTLYQNPALNVDTFTIQTTTDGYVGFSFRNSESSTTPWDDTTTIMLNTGSTALPFEPYGYKILITNAGQTAPVYFGQTQTVRRVRKLVLTGDEEWTYITDGKHWTAVSGYLKSGLMCICSHYKAVENGTGSGFITNGQVGFYSSLADRLIFCDTTCTTTDNWKSYLAAQYANGTPVCVWYVLAEPETAIINEHLAKIGDYADELSSEDAGVTIPTVRGQNTLTVDTELQPSSMAITYKK